VANFWGTDAALHSRRGVTHGVLAMVTLPLALAAVVWLWHRWRGSTAPTVDAPRFRPRAIVALAFLGVLSHPALDWLNTYGVRLLMPFDGRWFYGDTLFIIDPWFWLLGAAGVVLARSGSARAVAGWLVLAALATWLVVTSDLVGPGVKIGWGLGIAAIAALRWRASGIASPEAFSRAALATLALYIGLAFGFARLAESAIARQFAAAGEMQANPAPGVPWSLRVVVVEPGAYRIVARDGAVFTLPRREPDAIVKAALAQESIRGFATWMRYPHWTVEEKPDRWIVRFQDLRYQGPDIPNARGIGFAQAEVLKR
jgi:inner membrane protein